MTGRKRRRTAIAAVAMLAAVVLASTACTGSGSARAALPAQVDAEFPSELDTSLKAALDSAIALSASTGGIAGVWAPWSGEWTLARGSTTASGNRPMKADMHFRAGELTRGMTCTVLLRLVDAGTVELDEPIAKVLPSVPAPEGVTLGQLCQGTSGIADYTPQLTGQFQNNPTRPWPPLELVSNGLATTPTGQPGSVWTSSATGYVFLGLALEAATNKSWPTLYREHVLDPLALNETSLPDGSTLAVPGEHPAGYFAPRGADGVPICDAVRDASELSPSMAWTAGAMVSTVDDLKVWAQALATGALISDKAAKEQWKTIPMGGSFPLWQTYGLGAAQMGPMRGSAAEMPGYISAAFADPESGLTVVVMLNNSTAGAGFARDFALQLASMAARVPAADDQSAPSLQLPWTAEQMAAALQAAAVCQPPAGG